MKKSILVVGGAGYIGSHMVRLLLEKKYNVVIFDNLSTGHRSFIPEEAFFVKGDLKKSTDIQKVFKKYDIDAVMHFAAFSIVPDSVSNPLSYYENNVLSCINLLKVMKEHQVKKFIFSSTASVYGEAKKIPIQEDSVLQPTNPYGRSKLMIEQILLHESQANKNFSFTVLRYFNVAGAHSSGLIGESHNPETHLVPNILKVLTGERPVLTLFGDDYPTKDGYCIRDYIHVEDLCVAHLLALKAIKNKSKNEIFNLGNGNGFSVKQVVDTVESVAGKKVKVKIGPRRSGDPAKLIASFGKAQKVLGWTPQKSLTDMISSAWSWEQKRGRS